MALRGVRATVAAVVRKKQRLSARLGAVAAGRCPEPPARGGGRESARCWGRSSESAVALAGGHPLYSPPAGVTSPIRRRHPRRHPRPPRRARARSHTANGRARPCSRTPPPRIAVRRARRCAHAHSPRRPPPFAPPLPVCETLTPRARAIVVATEAEPPPRHRDTMPPPLRPPVADVGGLSWSSVLPHPSAVGTLGSRSCSLGEGGEAWWRLLFVPAMLVAGAILFVYLLTSDQCDSTCSRFICFLDGGGSLRLLHRCG